MCDSFHTVETYSSIHFEQRKIMDPLLLDTVSDSICVQINSFQWKMYLLNFFPLFLLY